jgi:hypothetical protein
VATVKEKGEELAGEEVVVAAASAAMVEPAAATGQTVAAMALRAPGTGRTSSWENVREY